jgi:type IV secretory pathway VirJ component
VISGLVVRVLRALAIAGAAVLGGTLVAFVVILDRDSLPADAAPHAGPSLKRLPLIETPAATANSSGALVVYYTGDNGWTPNDRGFTGSLAALGTPVVAVDTLHYFVWKRSPAEAASDLAAVIDRYSGAWAKRRIVLVGYSYGANVLPMIVRRLPQRVRARVALLALIAPVGRAELVLRPWSMMDITGPGGRSNVDEVAKLQSPPVLCIYGATDPYTICPNLRATRVRVNGGHQFVGERQAVVGAISAAETH